jgi:hypothetical protein
MKTLMIAAVIAAGISFHFTSHADDNIFDVTMPLEKKEVAEDINGGYAPFGLLDIFRVQKTSKPAYLDQVKSQDERDYFYAFGVPINLGGII